MDSMVAIAITVSLMVAIVIAWAIRKALINGHRTDAKVAFQSVVSIPPALADDFQNAKSEEAILAVAIRIATAHGVWSPGAIVKAAPDFEKALRCLATVIYNEVRDKQRSQSARGFTSKASSGQRHTGSNAHSNVVEFRPSRRRDDDDDTGVYAPAVYAASMLTTVDNSTCHSRSSGDGYSNHDHHCSGGHGDSGGGGSSGDSGD